MERGGSHPVESCEAREGWGSKELFLGGMWTDGGEGEGKERLSIKGKASPRIECLLDHGIQ